jgi:hypothetical protein
MFKDSRSRKASGFFVNNSVCAQSVPNPAVGVIGNDDRSISHHRSLLSLQHLACRPPRQAPPKPRVRRKRPWPRPRLHRHPLPPRRRTARRQGNYYTYAENLLKDLPVNLADELERGHGRIEVRDITIAAVDTGIIAKNPSNSSRLHGLFKNSPAKQMPWCRRWAGCL